MTGRGWWCLFGVVLMLLLGLLQNLAPLIVTGMALLLWFGWEWLFFSLRVRSLRRSLTIERQVRDERGPVSTLWAGRRFTVKAALRIRNGRLPYLSAADPVPFGVVHEEGDTRVDGELSRDAPLQIEYQFTCPLTGVARFEGLRIETSDLQGFFAHVTFLRDPVVLRILPAVLVSKSGGPLVKRHNELPPPGIHRLRQPGSGAELLDLRDYLPGDPPRTIAWKVSARRDRLVTKEFESEAPVRCILFLDVSSSVRVLSPPAELLHEGARRDALYFKPLDRLVELAAGVIRASASIRDLTGLCLFDEQSSRMVRPERSLHQQNRLMQLLGDAAALSPTARRADHETLTPIAYALAQEVYPDLLRPEVNYMPMWLTWLAAFPRYTRHRRGLFDALYRRKGAILLWCTTLLPMALLVVNLLALFFNRAPTWARGTLGVLLFIGTPVLVNGGWLLFLFSLLVSGKQRRLARWRKRLAALFTMQQGANADSSPGLGSGGIEALMQDDDLFTLSVQQFLAEHQTPCFFPLYDEQGRYQFTCPEKVAVLARALLEAAARGRDNELYVLLADLLELDGSLEPLLQALRVVLGRHHQVLIVCPWPQGVPLPEEDAPRRPRHKALRELLTTLTIKQMHTAYQRLQKTFARLGVQMICAASEESVPLILKRLERLRCVGGRR